AVGGGAHADDEHLITAELPGRTRLLTALTAELLAAAEPAEGCPPGRNTPSRPVRPDQLRDATGWNHD
ncbi:hypothetical protein ACFQ08_39465, partial [Streptosporangium algeriense]